jgi:hypothetical protein
LPSANHVLSWLGERFELPIQYLFRPIPCGIGAPEMV